MSINPLNPFELFRNEGAERLLDDTYALNNKVVNEGLQQTLYRQDRARVQDGFEQAREAQRKELKALDEAIALRKEVAALKQEVAQTKLESAAYQRAAFNILRGRKAAYNAMARLAEAWGKPFEENPGTDKAFQELQKVEHDKLAENATETDELQRYVRNTAKHIQVKIVEERLEAEGKYLDQKTP